MELFHTTDTLSYLIIPNFVSTMDWIEVSYRSRSSSSRNDISGKPYSDIGVCNTSLSCDKQQQSEVCLKIFLRAESLGL